MPINETFIREKWLPALRSGEYAQAKGRLRKPDGFCCLGVACDLMEGIAWEPTASGISYAVHISDSNPPYGETSLLPGSVAEFIGISSWGDFEYNGDPDNREISTETLTGLNDDLDYSFEKIADFIEHELLNPDSPYSFTGA